LSARPYVIINVAASADGKIDTRERRGASISSERDHQRVDALRASVDAVMVGGHTVVDEDPRLTVKSAELRAQRVARGLPENPAKVTVASSHLRLNPNGRFVTAGPARIMVFTPATTPVSTQAPLCEELDDASAVTPAPLCEELDDASAVTPATLREADSEAPLAALLSAGVEVFAVGQGRVDLGAAMNTLFDEGIRRLLVEGGGSLNFELLRLGVVDEVQIFVAPMIFGGKTAPTLADGAGLVRDAAVQLTQAEVDVWDDGGVVLRYKVKPRE
jgi:2,5-diamino-6-(ribosylamino)-4(3H)-pyrimidinone 5'-phosphate reductase